MALQGNPFEKRLSGKGPEITRKPKEFPPLNPWDDPEPQKKEESKPTVLTDSAATFNRSNQEITNSAPIDNKNNKIILDSYEQLTNIKITENTLTDYQSTKATSTEFELTESKRSELPLTESTPTKTPLTKHSLKPNPARNKRVIPKLTRKQLTKSKLTKNQSTKIQEPYSKSQGRWMLPEHDLLNLLAMTDKACKLTGNQWPVFLFMSLKAYEYDKSKGRRGTGVRRFAGSFLSRGLGLSPSTCNEAINELIAKGYVELLEKNNYSGNLYQVQPVLLYRPDPNQVDQKSVNVNSVDLKSDRNLTESQSGTWPKVSQDVDRKSDTLIDRSRSLDLSLSNFLKPLQLSELETRWLSFMKKEREREEKGLLKLFKEKPEEAETILKAFEIILKEQDEYGEIKSAISVLETNYTAQYRDKALAVIAQKQDKEKKANIVADEQTQKASNEDAEAKIQLIRMQCFEEAFPDLAIRKQYILNVCKDNPMFIKFGAGSPIATGYAVMQWAQGEGSSQVLAALDRETSQGENAQTEL